MLHLGTHGNHTRLREVLIVKIGAIGDVITALPMLSWLHEYHPGVNITWICGLVPAPLVVATNLVKTLIAVDDEALFQGSVWKKSKEVVRALKILKGKKFDLIITAHPDPRFRLLSASAYGKKRVTYQHVPGESRAETHIRLLAPEWKGAPIFPQLNCVLSKDLESIAASSPIALAPGGAKNLLREDALRRWPIENYVEVARHLVEKNVPVVLVGASSDSWVLPYFASLPVVNGIGKTSLTELVAFLEHCRLLITHDTGPLHLAKLARCKTLGIFGPTDPQEVGIYGESFRQILNCSPCYDGKNYAPCLNNLCMKKVSFSSVIKNL